MAFNPEVNDKEEEVLEVSFDFRQFLPFKLRIFVGCWEKKGKYVCTWPKNQTCVANAGGNQAVEADFSRSQQLR